MPPILHNNFHYNISENIEEENILEQENLDSTIELTSSDEDENLDTANDETLQFNPSLDNHSDTPPVNDLLLAPIIHLLFKIPQKL